MSMIEPSNFLGDPDRARRAWQLPVGAASPLWFLYAGAAGAGIAYWWMTRWARPVNLEAILGAGQKVAQIAVEASAPAAEAVLRAAEAAEESLEAVVEEVAEAEHAAHAVAPEAQGLEPVAAAVDSLIAPKAASVTAPAVEPEPAVADLAKAMASAPPKPKAATRRGKAGGSPSGGA